MDLPRDDPLAAVSPLDGRYADATAPLVPYASEAALIRARVRVEVEWLVAVADLDATPVTLDGDEAAALRDVHESFDADDARLVKRIETDGAAGSPATGHDVKAVEYFLRTRTDERLHPWLHFGLTSADVNGLAHRLLARGAVTDVVVPALVAVRDRLAALATEHRDAAMLGHTHGQPATPTTLGKELAVFAWRLDRAVDRIERATAGLHGSLSGATGTYAAHHAAYADVDWPAVAAAVVSSLGLDHAPLATQLTPGDDLAALFDALGGAAAVLLDLDRDLWAYASRGYLRESAADADGTTGSSTMPHKLNPTDAEHAEGNLERARSDLRVLADAVTGSRMQRDLSDSTLKRTAGAAFARLLIGAERTDDALVALAPDREAMRSDLDAHPEVLAEAYQTVLRREGHVEAYEHVRDATRGADLDLATLRAVLDDLDVDPGVRAELRALDPAEYTGIAAELVGAIDGADTRERTDRQ